MRRTALYILFIFLFGVLVYGLTRWAAAVSDDFFAAQNQADIHIHPTTYTFITDTEIHRILSRQTADTLDETQRIYRAEKALEENPFIRNAEVYYTAGGKLAVDIYQIEPLAYVQLPSGRKLMDTEGNILPVPAHDKPRLPVIETHTTRRARELYPLMKSIRNDTMLGTSVKRINARGDNIILYLRNIPPVELGGLDAYAFKLEKTKDIIRLLRQQNKLGQYRAIDVKYQGQVVCKK